MKLQRAFSLVQKFQNWLHGVKKPISDIQAVKRKSVPASFKQEVEDFVNYQQNISDLEEIRLKRIDKALNTNTYF